MQGKWCHLRVKLKKTLHLVTVTCLPKVLSVSFQVYPMKHFNQRPYDPAASKSELMCI